MALKIEKREQSDSGAAWVNIAKDHVGDYIWWSDADREEGLYADREPEARLKVAPGRNARARQLSRTLERRYDHLRRGGKLPIEVEDKVLRETMARALLEDWEGVEVNGTNAPYTPEAGIRAMKDDPDFEELVANIANKIARDRSDALVGDAETLGNESSGGSSSRASQEHGPKSGSSEG